MLGVVSVVGVGTTNATPNVAHFALTLKPKNDRIASASEIMRRLTAATSDIPGISTTFQIVQDIQIGTARSRTQYQYVLVGLDREGFSSWAKKLKAELKHDLRLIHVSSDIQEDGNAVMIKTDRVIAGRLGVTMQALNDTLYDAFGQRQVSTIYGQSNQYRVVLEVDPKYQTDLAALGSIYVPGNAISNSTTGNSISGLSPAAAGGATGSSITAVPADRARARGAGSVLFLCHDRAHHCAALRQPRPAIPRRHDQLRCRAWRVARRRRAGRRRRERPDWHAKLDCRQLSPAPRPSSTPR